MRLLKKKKILRDRTLGEVRPIRDLESGWEESGFPSPSRLVSIYLASLAHGVARFFFPLHHGPTRRKGWFVDLTSETVGSVLDLSTRTQDDGSGCPYAADRSPYCGRRLTRDVVYDRSTWTHHESRAHGGKKKEPLERWFSFLISTDSAWLCCHTYWWSRSSSKNTW